MGQLVFIGNQNLPAATPIIMRFVAPQDNGLPIWGPGNAGVTYIWRAFYRQHTGYHVLFWYGPYSSFFWNSGSPGTYYGFHPYPPGGASGTTHNWEIAVDGGDTQNTLGGSPKAVVKEQWFTQGARVWVNGDSTRTMRFYLDLPSTANGDIIEHTAPSTYGTTYAGDHALYWADSGWSAGNERMNGELHDGIKIFNSDIGESALLLEAANLRQKVTTNTIWWGKNRFRGPTDGLCDYGTGRRFEPVNYVAPGLVDTPGFIPYALTARRPRATFR